LEGEHSFLFSQSSGGDKRVRRPTGCWRGETAF
jgi:hypothetical protein